MALVGAAETSSVLLADSVGELVPGTLVAPRVVSAADDTVDTDAPVGMETVDTDGPVDTDTVDTEGPVDIDTVEAAGVTAAPDDVEVVVAPGGDGVCALDTVVEVVAPGGDGV